MRSFRFRDWILKHFLAQDVCFLPRMASLAALGPARVTRRASKYPLQFAGYTKEDLDGVMELPEDTFVLVLEREEADTGWAKVIFEEGGDAFRTWVHPDCVRTQRTEMCNIIHVEHTDKRGTENATVEIGTTRVGARWHGSRWVLDARWTGRGECTSAVTDCSGFCAPIIEETACEKRRMGDILKFAVPGLAGVVACQNLADMFLQKDWLGKCDEKNM